jgi:hypothetical protein
MVIQFHSKGYDFSIQKFVDEITPASLTMRFTLNVYNKQLLFLFKSDNKWVLLKGLETDFLSKILNFFTTHTVYFGRSYYISQEKEGKVVLCRGSDYESFIEALNADEEFWGRPDDVWNEWGMSYQCFCLAEYVVTFVAEAEKLNELSQFIPNSELYNATLSDINELDKERDAKLGELEAAISRNQPY